MFTGFEKELGLYNDSLKIAKVPYKILHRIEKFPSHPGKHYSLVVQDTTTGIISLIENKYYTNLAEDHGYFRSPSVLDSKSIGASISKGDVLSKSSSHDEFLNYRYGVNAKVANISKKDNIEDGIIISESFANRVSYASIKTVEVTLGFNDILLNIYGDNFIYKSFPDIFQEVKNGIFCVKRSIDHMNAGCRTTVDALMSLDTDDEIYHADGFLIDVEIFVNSNAELVKDNGHRQQIITYYNIVRDYKYKVMKALEPFVKSHGYNITTDAATKYHNYKNYIDTCNSPTNDIRFINSTGSFEFAYIKFTVGKNNNLTEGSKLTNRFGGKGVVCRIVPDELMPKDKYGTVAEVILNPCSIPGRSNPGQLYEQELNFIATRVVAQMKETTSLVKRYSLLSKFMKIADKESSDYFEKYYRSMTTPQKQQYMEIIIENGIYVRQHPFNNISYENLKNLYKEFDVRPSRVEVGVKLDDGTIKKYKSKNAVVIGDEYIMVLKHTTESKSSSVSISDVNSLGLPHKSNAKKAAPFRNTPIKFGEMEVNIAINRCSPLIVNRFLAGNGSNLKHRDRVSKMLLEKDPFCYHDVNVKNEEIIDGIASDAFCAIIRQLGYTIYSVKSKRVIEVGVNPNEKKKLLMKEK